MVLNTNPMQLLGFFFLSLQMTGLLEKSSHKADQIITIVRDFQAFIHRHSYYYIVGSQNRGITEAVDVLGNKSLILTTVLTTKVIPCKLWHHISSSFSRMCEGLSLETYNILLIYSLVWGGRWLSGWALSRRNTNENAGTGSQGHCRWRVHCSESEAWASD